MIKREEERQKIIEAEEQERKLQIEALTEEKEKIISSC